MRIIAWTAIFAVLVVFAGVSLIEYFSLYSSESINLSELMKSGIMSVISLISLFLGINVFLIYIFVDQIGKLKNILGTIDKSLDNVETTVNKFNENLELLM